uniref:Uncharacterized protein n=1 Tax=Brassica campestris TaxID=3711 RepID=M4FIZ0_BRACM
MDSSSSKRNHPRLLYKKGKAPSQQTSMSHNFQMVEEGVGLYGWDDDVDDDDVTNLVHDISHNCVDRRFWDVNEEPPTTTRKKCPTSIRETDVESSKKKKANDTKTYSMLILLFLFGKVYLLRLLILLFHFSISFIVLFFSTTATNNHLRIRWWVALEKKNNALC